MVSVIIPNYNHSKYLDQRIQSVLYQTYQDFEIIILDDKSTDDSLKVIDKYINDSHVSHIVVNETNSGSTFLQWYKGIKLAKGEVVWIAESDDYCEPTLLEELLKLMYSVDNCTLAYTTSLQVDASGNPLEIQCTGRDRFFSGEKYVCDTFVLGNFVLNASCAIFKRETALKVGELWKSFKGSGDTLLWILISLQGNVAVIDKQLNYFRRYPGVVTDKRFRDGTNFHEEFAILKYIRNNVESWTASLDNLAVRHRCLKIIFQEFNENDIEKSVADEWGIDAIIKTWKAPECLKTRKCITNILIDEKRHLVKTGLLQYRRISPGALDYIKSSSTYWFYIFFLNEICTVGLQYAIQDYKRSCVLNGINPNPFLAAIAPVRVKLGKLILDFRKFISTNIIKDK